MTRRWTWQVWVRQGVAALAVLFFVQCGWAAVHSPADQWHAEIRFAEYDCSHGRICTLRPGQVKTATDARGIDYRYTTNSQGFRDRDHALTRPDPRAIRVEVYGSSPVFGLGVDDGETLAVALERELTARLPGRPVEVLSFGLPETSFASALAIYEDFGRAYEPDAIVFVQPEMVRLADMNNRVRQIAGSRLLRGLLGFSWGRRLVNRFQYATMGLDDPPSRCRPSPTLVPALRGLVEDAARRHPVIHFFSLWDRLGPFSDIAPPGLVWSAGRSGLARREYLESPLALPHDGHPSAEGHRRFAAQIADDVAPRILARLIRQGGSSPPK